MLSQRRKTTEANGAASKGKEAPSTRQKRARIREEEDEEEIASTQIVQRNDEESEERAIPRRNTTRARSQIQSSSQLSQSASQASQSVDPKQSQDMRRTIRKKYRKLITDTSGISSEQLVGVFYSQMDR